MKRMQVTGQAHLGDDSLSDRGFDRGDLKAMPHKVLSIQILGPFNYALT